jgi:hypothetical protein
MNLMEKKKKRKKKKKKSKHVKGMIVRTAKNDM